MSMSYPELQEFFISCYFNNDIIKFTSQLMDNLVKDKESRKNRFAVYTEEKFFK